MVLNVVTGAAVRLSDSGLGCPDWPTCSQHHLTPPLSLHPLIEFGNRLVVTLLVVSCAVTVVASFLRRPARRDLRWLSGGLILGVLGEAVLGAFVVYSKLNAYVVMTHFMVGMALLAVAVILTLEAVHGPGRGTPVVAPSALWLTRALLALIVIVLAAGTATTGAGPHAGGQGGQADPHRSRGHDPDPRRDRALRRSRAPRPALGAVADQRPGPCPGCRPGPAGRHGRPGDRRVHPVLHPPAGGPGRDPRVRGIDGVGHRPLVPPRAVRPPARGGRGTRPGVSRRSVEAATRGSDPGTVREPV